MALRRQLRRRVSAQLSIEKTVKGVDQTDGYTGSYELKITNGFSQTDRITVEDYITGFDNIYQTLGSDGSTTPIPGGSYNTEGTGAEVRALVRHMKVRNVVIRMTVPGASGSTVVYQNGAFTPQWSSSSFTDANSGSFSEKPGALFLVKLQPDGETKIPAGAEFTVSYETQLNMDTPLPGETQSFRESDYYLGGGLLIRNGAVASRTYDRVTDGQTGRTRAGLPTGNRDGNLLTVDCGGSVSCVYLRKDQLTKKNSSSGNGGNQWLICAETGTIGKTTFPRTSDQRAPRRALQIAAAAEGISGSCGCENSPPPPERRKWERPAVLHRSASPGPEKEWPRDDPSALGPWPEYEGPPY